MTPENKQRVRDAFNKAMDRNPESADKPIPELEKQNILLTSRELITQMLDADGFYDGFEKMAAAGKRSFEELLHDIENMKLPMRPKITPPKP